MTTKSKPSHCIIRNSNLFCENCGRAQVIPYPIDIDMYQAMSKQFIKSHKSCKKTYTPPVINMNLSKRERATWWYEYGERGSSSESIYRVMMELGSGLGAAHPLDPSDFHRCYKLLQCVPEWRGRMTEMKAVSKQWSTLIDNWDKLTELLQEQLDGKENNMSEVMDIILK
jgi:hypothetical protein